jgi:hypothetical protein
MGARNALLMAVLAGLSWACDTREAFPDPGLLPAVLLNVANANAHDVDVYALQGGQRLRLARLWAGEDGVVEIGPPLVETGEFMLEVYTIGLDSSYRTPGIAIMGQMHIELRIDRDLTNSTFSVTYGAAPDSIPSPAGETS